MIESDQPWRPSVTPYWKAARSRPAHVDGPETEWDKLLFLPPPGQRRTHTHVRVQGRANQRYALLFRDYLRAHPAIAEAYAELKRRLAQSLANRKRTRK